MTIEQIASAVYNDVEAGLVGMHSNPTMDMEQLQDEVVDMRNQVILE